MPEPSLYEVLGVPKNANAKDIKKAYFDLAKVVHPDKGGDEERFKQIQTAYDVLSDDDRRRKYDMTGNTQDQPGQENPFGFGGMPGMHPMGGFGMPGMHPMGGMPFNMGDMFGNMFGPRQPGQTKRPKGANKVHELSLSLSDFYLGKKVRIDLDREVFCVPCNGKGHLSVNTCGDCRGSGIKETLLQIGPGMMAVNRGPCGSCRGEGTIKGTPCSPCSARGVVFSQKVLSVTITPGSSLGETIIFPEACSDSQEAEKPGDLHIRLTAADEPGLDVRRDGVTIRCNFTISLTDTLLGSTRRLRNHPGFPDGLDVPIPAGTQRNEEVILVGKGMPDKKGGFGDCIAHIDVKVTAEEKAYLEKHAMSLQAMFTGKDPVA